MSLQHDECEHERCYSYETVQALVKHRDDELAAVRGEVERLTAELIATRQRVELLSTPRNRRAETAEASLRSLRDALEKLVAWDKKYPKGIVMNMGRFDESERVLDAICEEARNALTPAAPDSTKSTESTAARKSNDWTTPTTDAARKETE